MRSKTSYLLSHYIGNTGANAVRQIYPKYGKKMSQRVIWTGNMGQSQPRKNNLESVEIRNLFRISTSASLKHDISFLTNTSI